MKLNEKLRENSIEEIEVTWSRLCGILIEN
jgi:hypothetical protein